MSDFPAPAETLPSSGKRRPTARSRATLPASLRENPAAAYRIGQLIDIPQLQGLMDSLYQATHLANAIIDMDGKVLSAAGWQRICTAFHRVHPATCARCLESDRHLFSQLGEDSYTGHRCPNGLMVYYTPVVIEGKHLANLFIGQIFHEPPDLDFFRRQAAEFGFDEASYMAALGEVPIFPRERMPGIMAFLQNLALTLASGGMERLRMLESEKRLQNMNEELEQRVAERTRELQDSAAGLRHAQQIAQTGSWTLDIANNHLVWSDEAYRLFGVSSDTPLTLESFLACTHPDDRQAFTAAWQEALGGKPYDFEHRIVVAGGIKWVHEQAEVEFDADGQAYFALGTVQDITEYKRLELQLLELNHTLEQRVAEEVARNMEQEHMLIQQSRLAAMGEMIGNIAHQWRQPINALALLLANIKDAYEYQELDGDFLDESVKTGNRLIHGMSATIDDFRNFFKPDKEKRPFRVCDGVDAAFKMVSAAFKSANIEIGFERCRIPCSTFGYPNEFEQVILNVLTNAKDAILATGKHGTVHIHIKHDGDTVVVILRDSGGGIPDNILDRVFDPYFTTKEKGTGIGLYMSKTIMRNMGGDITIRNAGAGAEVRITLPLAADAAA